MEKTKTTWKQVGAAWLNESTNRISLVLDEPVEGRVYLFPNDRRSDAIERSRAQDQDTSFAERLPTHTAVVALDHGDSP